ncbi:hypothetical protein ONS96_012443 [Cadophora gregata f. sp. sojae]|nr:hypothetical protein ONS96_012443 [Cadophora gregata f. sp. sojae]
MSDFWNDPAMQQMIDDWQPWMSQDADMAPGGIDRLLSFNQQGTLIASSESNTHTTQTPNQAGSKSIDENASKNSGPFEELFDEQGGSDVTDEYGTNDAGFVKGQECSEATYENTACGMGFYDQQDAPEATYENTPNDSDFFDHQESSEYSPENAMEQIERTYKEEIQQLKAAHEKTIKEMEMNFQQALAAKEAEVNTAKAEAYQNLKCVHQMSLQVKKFAENMNSMQMKMKQMKATVNSLNFPDTPNSSTSTTSPDTNFSFTYHPSQTFTPTRSTQPFTPQSPAQQYFFDNGTGTGTGISIPPTPIPSTPDPAPTKKRRASASPFIGQFYQCRQQCNNKIPSKDPNGRVASAKDGRTLFCGVINNQYMAGGKTPGEHRQRCVNRECRKYTDVKEKHWVEGWVVDVYGVGGKAPMETPKWVVAGGV